MSTSPVMRIALLFVLLTTGACAQHSASGGQPTDSAGLSVITCEHPPLTLAQTILARQAEGSPAVERTLDMWAARGKPHDRYFVAVSFRLRGEPNDQTAIWSTTSLKPSGRSFVAEDALARRLTSWPRAAHVLDPASNPDQVGTKAFAASIATGCMTSTPYAQPS